MCLPIGFAGGLFDADTGLTRLVWRDYDVDTGRCTALDLMGEKGGDKNLYGYCIDDPVNRLDVWGLRTDVLFDFGGEGRSPLDGPTYGNYCGKNWTGGWNPKEHGNRPGPLPSTDSLDEQCRAHDYCWSDCDIPQILNSANDNAIMSLSNDLRRSMRTLPSGNDSHLQGRRIKQRPCAREQSGGSTGNPSPCRWE